MKKPFLFFVGVLLFSSLFSQSSATCVTSKTLVSNDTCINNDTLTGTEKWFSFVANQSSVHIGLALASFSADHVHKMVIYSGACGSLTALDSVKVTSTNDTLLHLHATNLISGNTYYIKAVKSATCTTRCTNSDAIFNICLGTLGNDDGNCGLNPGPIATPVCNILCNGSFDTFWTCPVSVGELANTFCWNIDSVEFDPIGWPGLYNCLGPNDATPDFFHTNDCPAASTLYEVSVPANFAGVEANNSTALVGGYAGVLTFDKQNQSLSGFINPTDPTYNYREYLQQKLSIPMIVGKKYRFATYLSLSDSSAVATYFGTLFSTVPYDEPTGIYINRTPHFETQTMITNKVGWTLFDTTFVADSAYRWMIIGNFRPDVLSNMTIVDSSLSISRYAPGFGVITDKMSYYYIDEVSVTPLDSIWTSVSDSDSTICDGSEVTLQTGLSIVQPLVYYWTSFPVDTSLTGQDSLNIITVTPHDTTFYYTEITDIYGCVHLDTTQINVVPVPPRPLVVGDSFACVTGTPITYTIANYDSTLTYTIAFLPLPTGAIASAVDTTNGTFTVTWSDNLGATMFITALDSIGCDSIAEFIIKPCCIYGDTTFINDSASALLAHYLSTGIVSGQSFSINGTLTIDQDLTIYACDVKLGIDAVINILPPYSLYITQASELSACDFMWDKIKIQPGAVLKVDKNAIIEDGKTAIYSIAGGKYDLNGARLNRNYKHMELTPFTGVHTGTIVSTRFSCQPMIGTIATLNPPYTGYRTDKGIEINGVQSVTIGSLTASAATNFFRNMNLGINAVKSSVTIINNSFRDIDFGVFPNSGIAAIQAIGNPVFPSYVARTLIVGDGTASGTNTFKNCFNGIITEQNINSKILLNDFKQINNKAVFIKGNGKNNTVLIDNNDFATTAIGVHCLNNTICRTTIRYNKMNNMKNFSTGVWIQEISSSSIGAMYTVFNNTIKTVEYGIRAENLSKATIDNNTIETEPYAPSILVSTGIQVLGNYGTRITSNNVKIVPTTYATKNGGIYASLSPASYIYCNTVANMGYGIKCAGAMPSDIFNNSMNNDFYGLWLDNNGFIGTQDNPSVAGQPSYNKWTNIPVTGASTTSKRTLTTLGTIGSSSPIVYKTGAFPPALNAIYLPSPTQGIGAVPFTLIDTTAGSSFSPACPLALPPALLKQAQDIALENISFPGNDANSKWLSKHGLLVNIKNDSIDVSSDPILQMFVTLSETDNMGKLTELNSTITDPTKYNTTDMNTAQALSSGIEPNNDIETNHKLINDIVINSFLASTSYTTAQINDLRLLANKCPFTDGLAVYEARVLLSEIDTLGTVYYNACELDGEARMASVNTDPIADENTELMVYPNPATDQLTVNYKVEPTDIVLFEIYNLIGEKVLSYTLSASHNEQSLSLAGLNAGVYMYKYTINGQNIKADKLVIVK